jgi:DNA polymerase III delta subunit
MVVLHGVEDFLLQVYSNALREALAKEQGEIDVVTFNGETATAADILDECRSFGLIATHKLVLVDHADEVVKEENRALFERYAEGLIAADGEASATLVLRCKTWRAGKLDKLIEQVGTIKECREVTDAEAIKWAMERCKKRHSAELTREAADLLIARAGPSLGRIDSELGKLAAAAGLDASGKTNPITPQVVAEFVKVSREEEIWAMQGTLLTGDLPRMLSELTYEPWRAPGDERVATQGPAQTMGVLRRRDRGSGKADPARRGTPPAPCGTEQLVSRSKRPG